jgi:hypothetical protein
MTSAPSVAGPSFGLVGKSPDGQLTINDAIGWRAGTWRTERGNFFHGFSFDFLAWDWEKLGGIAESFSRGHNYVWVGVYECHLDSHSTYTSDAGRAPIPINRVAEPSRRCTQQSKSSSSRSVRSWSLLGLESLSSTQQQQLERLSPPLISGEL